MGLGPVDPLEVRRHRLLGRLQPVVPKILACIAPAGFGKSTLVRQLIATIDRRAVLDCSGVRDDLDLARRLLSALATESPETKAALLDRQLALGDGGTSVAERIEIALEAWRQASGGAIVLESAEHIGRCLPVRELFVRLLEQRPHARSVIVCSRENLRLRFTRYAAPHEILVLRAADLAFDVDDVRSIFAPYVSDSKSIERIAAVSQGWPIAVFLLKRFASEGRIAALLERLDDIAFEELHDYLADEVVAELEPALRRALFVCASIPQATQADIRGALDDARTIEEFVSFAKESPFVTREDDGVFVVHPLLRALLLEHEDDDRFTVLRDVARAHEGAGDYLRAAELYLACSDQATAARALGRHEVLRDATPPPAYFQMLDSLDRVLIARHPRLWGVTALLRLFCVSCDDLLNEAESIWRTLPAQCSAVERYYVFVFRVLLMSYMGLFDETLEMIDRFTASSRINDPPVNLLDGHIIHLRGLLRARTGRFSDADRDLRAALPLVEDMDVVASGTFVSLGADIARVRGERPVERHFIERAIERAQASGLPNVLAFDYAEALIGAWLAGEATASNEYAHKLDDCVKRFNVHGFGYLAAAARGVTTEPTAADLPKFVAFGRLIALGNTTDDAHRVRLAESAYGAALESRQPFVEALAAIAVGTIDETRRDEMFARAHARANACEAPNFTSALEALQSGSPDAGMLSAFVGYLTRETVTFIPPLTVDVLTGLVTVDGHAIDLGGRELELVIALALRREATARSRLATWLWPDVEDFAARNALSVCLHRLRRHLGRRDAIVRDGDGYALHAQAIVDIWEIDRTVATLRSRDVANESQRPALARTWKLLRQNQPVLMERWEWFEPTRRRLAELRVEVGGRLGRDALSRGDIAAALEYAQAIIDDDPCDESAREIAIRAHLHADDRAAALRHFRQYRTTLLAELQCEPSPAIVALLA